MPRLYTIRGEAAGLGVLACLDAQMKNIELFGQRSTQNLGAKLRGALSIELKTLKKSE